MPRLARFTKARPTCSSRRLASWCWGSDTCGSEILVRHFEPKQNKSVGQNVRPTRVLQALADLFSDRFRLREQQQIIRAASLRICSRHIEATERMRADNCAGALAINVEITDVELAHCHFNLVARSGITRTGQAKLGIFRDIERLLKVARFNYRQYRTENFLLLELRFRLNICDYGWLDEITFARISGA